MFFNSLALSAGAVGEVFLQLRNPGPVSLDTMAIIPHLDKLLWRCTMFSILLWCVSTDAVLKLVKIFTCQISLLEFTIIYWLYTNLNCNALSKLCAVQKNIENTSTIQFSWCYIPVKTKKGTSDNLMSKGVPSELHPRQHHQTFQFTDKHKLKQKLLRQENYHIYEILGTISYKATNYHVTVL